MAYLWHYLNDHKWAPTELHSAAVLRRGSVDFVGNNHMAARHDEALLYPHATNRQLSTWTLLAPSQSRVHINDAALENGIRVLANRDAIRICGLATMYFSTERLAGIEAYPDAEPVFCPRCKMMISEGDAAVCCAQCGVWHHEQLPDGRTCWSYSTTCSLCEQSTDLDSAGFRWTPEELWS